MRTERNISLCTQGRAHKNLVSLAFFVSLTFNFPYNTHVMEDIQNKI
jgi:hypothetical protein